MKSFFKKETAIKISAIIFAILVWQICAEVMNLRFILVSPLEVFVRLFTIWSEEGFVSALLFSFLRITGGFFAALVFGTLLAVLAGRFKSSEMFLSPYISAIKSVPVASFVIIAIFLFSSSYLSVFISFLISFPVVYTNILAGIHNTEKKMTEMARIFGLSFKKRFLYIFLPAIKPYLISACSVSTGLAWKSGIAAELIGIPAGSVGEKLYFTKLYYEMGDLFAWTVIIVAISAIFEKVLVSAIKHSFDLWERSR